MSGLLSRGVREATHGIDGAGGELHLPCQVKVHIIGFGAGRQRGVGGAGNRQQ